MISEELRQELHGRLLEERARAQEESARLGGGGLSAATFQEDETDAVAQHPADDGSELFEREKNMAVLSNSEASLRQIDAALRKFDEGTYGTCDNCGNPIDEKRLRALPEATLCISCQAEVEQRARA